MAKQPTLASVTAACLLLFRLVAALQVTPNSPCSSFCLDAPDLDESDPESSNTSPEEIICKDEDFASKPEGQKFQRCLTCLQDSPFSNGHESDQQWFFYNLRYAFDFCVMGLPNGTKIESNPCITSEACGRIEDSLQDGILEPAYSEPYNYCEADGGAIRSTAVDNCLACVRAGSSQNYISNFLTAIQAGCEQQPAEGITVGLSDTVFSIDPINIVAPSSSSSDSSDSGPSLSTPVIAAIAIGAFVALLLVAGCVFMQVRKRRNRAARAAHRASPLSFRCQTHLTPKSPTFPYTGDDNDNHGDGGEAAPPVREKAFIDPASALNSNPVGSKWHSPDSLRSSQAGGLSSITTSMPMPPAMAAAQHSSPRMYSPDDHYHITPTSTTSNAPLLNSFKPYVPADYSGQAPFPIPGIAISTPEEMPSPYGVEHRSPSVGGSTRPSPRMEQGAWYNRPSQPAWEPQGFAGNNNNGSGTRELVKKKRAVSGSPVSVSYIQTSFPPPPKR